MTLPLLDIIARVRDDLILQHAHVIHSASRDEPCGTAGETVRMNENSLLPPVPTAP